MPQAGYAVIFLTRTGSIQPFTQDLPLTETVPLLQSMLGVQDSSSGSYSLQEPAAGRVAGILQKVEEVQQSQQLLTVPFTTIFEYLQVCVGCVVCVCLTDRSTCCVAGLLCESVLTHEVKHGRQQTKPTQERDRHARIKLCVCVRGGRVRRCCTRQGLSDCQVNDLPACLLLSCGCVLSLAVPASHCSGAGPPGAAGGLLPGSCCV